MKTPEEILRNHFDFDKRNYINGMPHLDELSLACREYAEQYRRLAKDAAFELGNANIQILKLEERIKRLNENSYNDGKNSSYIHSGGKGGWSV